MKTPKTNLRKLEWESIVEYFSEFSNKDEILPKDLVDYFHFRYLENTNIRIWTVPNYIRQSGLAKKLLSLYGGEYSLRLVDVLFEKHHELMGRTFADIKWSLGLLSSDKMGWLMEKLYIECNKSRPNKIYTLLKKPRNEWTDEEMNFFNAYIKGEKNGS